MVTKIEQQAQKARQLYGGLVAKTPNDVECAQLRDAGVSESRIRSLYPFEVGEVLEVLRSQVEANGMHRWASPNFRWSSRFTYWARRADMSPALWDEFVGLRDSLASWGDFPAEVRRALIHVILLRNYPNQCQLMAEMAMSFWEACWLEAHIDQIADPARIHARFLDVMMRLTPKLWASAS